MSTNTATTTNRPQIAIVGGGIIGLVLALGLDRRGINVRVYEQANSHREIGAGIAFTANAVRCMGEIDPRLVTALRSVATSNGDPRNPNDHLQWVDGFNVDPQRPGHEELLYKLYAGPRGFEGCHRAHFLAALLEVVPKEIIFFGKRLAKIIERGHEEKVQLVFEDGSTVEADAVIGCDGIKSRVRELMFGAENRMSQPTYTHKLAYRGLIPMNAAVEAIGEYKAKNQHMHLGPGAHLLHFPVADQKLMNVVAFASDPDVWEDSQKFVAPATRDEVASVFADWGPTVRSIVSLLPPQLDKWAVFDSFEAPVPYYHKRRICIAGDAAHAAAPHHGAGAGVGVEDALCLSVLLERIAHIVSEGSATMATALQLAFTTFNRVRRERTQWVVQSSHEVCEIYEWNHDSTGSDPHKCFAEIQQRSHKIWNFDYEEMVRESCETLDGLVAVRAFVEGRRETVSLPFDVTSQDLGSSESESMSDGSASTPREVDATSFDLVQGRSELGVKLEACSIPEQTSLDVPIKVNGSVLGESNA